MEFEVGREEVSLMKDKAEEGGEIGKENFQNVRQV